MFTALCWARWVHVKFGPFTSSTQAYEGKRRHSLNTRVNARLASLLGLLILILCLSAVVSAVQILWILLCSNSIKTAVSMYFTGAEIMDDRGELANITKNQEGRRIWTGKGKKQGQRHNNSHVMVSILSRGKV